MTSAPFVVVVGNPQPGSRTLRVAQVAAERIVAVTGEAIPVEVIDLSGYGPALLERGNADVGRLADLVRSARGLLVASPTFKASFTGLTKLFLEQFGSDELAGLPTVPLMTGAGPAHTLAVEVALRPVLIEIGASCPTRGIYLSGDEVDDPAAALDGWLAGAGPVLAKALA